MFQYLKLCKSILSIAIAFSAIVGYSISQTIHFQSAFLLFLGVFFLSAGASALNQYLERKTDTLMQRTASRPIPAGIITPKKALITVVICIALGTLILSFLSLYTVLLGLLNVVLYAFVYTPLKYKSNLATIPGGLVGAIPPLMGWFAAGEQTFSIGIVFFATFMFLWQIPHFLILNLKYSEDYKKAGISTIVGDFSQEKMKMIFLLWACCAIIVSFLFPIVGLVSGIFQMYLLLSLNIAILALFIYLVFYRNGRKLVKGNIFMHSYLLLQFLLIVYGRFVF
jgi:protoheme IX farnesyltransferase